MIIYLLKNNDYVHSCYTRREHAELERNQMAHPNNWEIVESVLYGTEWL